MRRDQCKWWLAFGVLSAVCLLFIADSRVDADSDNLTSVNVLVKDAESGKPIFQARLTLVFQYREPGKLSPIKRAKTLTFSAKTDLHGRYRFAEVSKGTVRLIVTAPDHQTFSKEFEVNEDNPLLEVKLKKPQPLL
jgi:Carboxypeptidase regulatory-like domain